MSDAATHGQADAEPDHEPESGPRVEPQPAAGFTVLYDANCPVCRRARAWAEGQAQLVPLRFLPAGGAQARRRFPDVDHAGTLVDITTIGDDGAIRRGKSAWITVLWAVARTRTLANDLAAGRKRRTFGTVVGGTELLRKVFGSDEATVCTTEACRTITPTSGEWLPPTSGEWLPPGVQPGDTETEGRVRRADRDELW